MTASTAARRTHRKVKPAAHAKGDGPFRFVKLSATGGQLRDDALDWVAVLDTTTGLEWTRSTLPCGAVPYARAAKEPAKLKLAGKARWRAPTRAERLSIVDDTLVGPALDPRYFDVPQPYGWEWTSTPFASCPREFAWDVGFNSGSAGWLPQSYLGFVRACRASQSSVLWLR